MEINSELGYEPSSFLEKYQHQTIQVHGDGFHPELMMLVDWSFSLTMLTSHERETLMSPRLLKALIEVVV
jgi:hypothetical protein